MTLRGAHGGAARRRARAMGCAALLLVAAVAAAEAGEPSGPPAGAPPTDEGGGLWLSVGLIGGFTQLSRNLADYQWNTTPRPSWGAQARVGGRRISGGVRLWRT